MRKQTMQRLALLGLSVFLCLGPLPAGTAAARSTTAHYTLRYTATDDSEVVGRGGDVVLLGGAGGMTLVSHTGASRALVAPPGCAGPPVLMVGGDTLLDTCESGTGWFTQQTNTPGSWRPFPPSGQLDRFCQQYGVDTLAECGPAAVGRRWIQLQGTCYHCAVAHRLVSIADGRLVADPTRGRVIADLNAPRPARRRCPGVTAPPGGSAQFVGDLGLITSGRIGRGFTYRIKRCHTAQAMTVQAAGPLIGTAGGQVATNATLIVWPGPHGLSGIQARTDRRFTLSLPNAMTGVDQLAISSTALYVGNGSGELWTAPLPAALAAVADKPAGAAP